MILDQFREFDGMNSFVGGVDAGADPALIRADQVSRAVNLTARGGQLSTRPGFDRVALTFGHEVTAERFRTGRLQGAASYTTRRGSYIIAVVSGRIFEIGFESPDFASVREVTPPGLPNNAEAPVAYLCQAGPFMVIQDGESQPVIFDGNTSRRAEAKEVPVGTAMAFGLGRLWVASGELIFAGDIAGSKNNAEISFEEDTYLAERSGFPFPSDLGAIRALVFPAIQDTATGQGDLLVIGDYGAISIAAATPRLLWKDTPGMIRVAMRNFGATGAAAFTLVNGDIYYRAIDGIRSYRMAAAEQQGWGQVPLSRELDGYLATDAPELLAHARMAVFDNRLLTTFGPQVYATGAVRHSGLAVLDFAVASGLGRQSSPAYDGVWTGPLPTEIVVGRFGGAEQCFIFSLNSGENRIFRLTRDAPFDLGSNRITSSFVTRSFDFGTPFNEKRLHGADFWFSDMWGTLDVEVLWKPDAFPAWANWDTLSECAPYQTTAVGIGQQLRTPRRQHRSRVRLKTPPETADPLTYKQLVRGMSFQLHVELKGCARLSKFRVHAQRVPEDPSNNEGSAIVCQSFDVHDVPGMVVCENDLKYLLPEPAKSGCTNPLALNYDPTATLDDGSCVFDGVSRGDGDHDGGSEIESDGGGGPIT